MKNMYVTITGTNHYYGMHPFWVGKKIKCIKEKDNVYDENAIRAYMREFGTVGYIANSPYTVANGTLSAGRIYDRVKNEFQVKVMFMTSTKVICKVLRK